MRTHHHDVGFLSFKDSMLKEKYDFYRVINRGSFGIVYEVRNKLTNKISALKIEYRDDNFKKNRFFINEIHILKKLQGTIGIPEIRDFGKCKKGYYFEIQLLQQSLQQEAKKNFSIVQLNKIAKELLLILKKIHENKVIHQDIKPQNIMKDKYGRYYFIDFGLSKIINGKKSTVRNPGFIGTPRFASLTAHQGKIQTEKDDIQSLFYVLAFLNLKKLPWFRVSANREKKLNEIQRKKQFFRTQIFKAMSKGFFLAFEYVTQLKDGEEVNYDYLVNLLGKERNTLPTKIILNEKLNKNMFRTQNICTESPKLEEEKSEQTMSRMAHIQYLSTIQLLAQKILLINEKESLDHSENITQSGQYSNQAIKAAKHNIKFKNPFLNS